MPTVRTPAVAGMFYPAGPHELQATVNDFLNEPKATGATPKAIIVPHAGFIYSGPVAAHAYACLRPAREQIRRVILIGPSHRVFVRGLALPEADAFDTPLGRIEVDREAVAEIRDLPQIVALASAHANEHSLEVQLPFLQEVLSSFRILPLSAGQASPAEVAEVLDRLWDGAETLIVISTDLSHYNEYDTARKIDAATSRAIESLQYDDIGPEQACGCTGLNGLLYLARQRGLQVRTLCLANSGDTAGPRDRVVGYGAYVVN